MSSDDKILKMRDYRENTDKEFLRTLFKDFWLQFGKNYSEKFDENFFNCIVDDRILPALGFSMENRFENCRAKNMEIKICCLDSVIVGFVIFASKPRKCKDKRYGDIIFLGVEGKFSRKGIGGYIIDYAEKVFSEKGYTRSIIGVYKDNIAARNLYEKKGYVVCDDQVDKVFLSKKIVYN